MNKAIFLDRDGTINVDYGYVYEKEKLTFVDGVVDALKRLQDAGYKLIVVTNQSGIARGYFSEEQYREFEKYFKEQLAGLGVVIDDIYYCPHGPEDHCQCRKPQLKMFLDAIEKWHIDCGQSFAIGDRVRDLELCKKKPVKGILYSDKSENGYLAIPDWNEIAEYILCENGENK